MLGQGAVKPTDTAEERSKNIFMRYKEGFKKNIENFIMGPAPPRYGKK